MKKLLIFSFFVILFSSCQKETLTNNIYGDWYFTEAYETDNDSNEYDLLFDYENITVTFNRDDSFIWLQDGTEYPGNYSIGNNRVTLNFNDGDKEEWKNYSINRNRNKLSYSFYDDGSHFEFELTKITTNFSRR